MVHQRENLQLVDDGFEIVLVVIDELLDRNGPPVVAAFVDVAAAAASEKLPEGHFGFGDFVDVTCESAMERVTTHLSMGE